MDNLTFMTAWPFVWLKGKLAVTDSFLSVEKPNRILGAIPVGKLSRQIPLNQVSSVNHDFRVSLTQMFVPLAVFFIFTFVFKTWWLSLIMGLIAAWFIVNSLQTTLFVRLTSGETVGVPFVIFEKAKAQKGADMIQTMLNKRNAENADHYERA